MPRGATAVDDLTPVEEGEGLDTHGEESCGEWDGRDGSEAGYLSFVRRMESDRHVVLLVSSVGTGETEARAAIDDLMASALCR